MKKNDTDKFSKCDMDSIITIHASKLPTFDEIDEPHLIKYIDHLINDIYRKDQDYNLNNTPIDVSADWLARSRNTGEILWTKTASKLVYEFDKLYKKTKNNKFAIASEILQPTDEVFKKFHSRLNK